MEQVNVLLFVESRYKINRKRVKGTVGSVLHKNEIDTPVEVSIAVVGDRKMRELSKKYKGEDKTRNVLSFSQAEENDREAGLPNRHGRNSEGFLLLGDIVISYPEVIREASKEEVLVDDKIDELVAHGLSHLLGIQHE